MSKTQERKKRRFFLARVHNWILLPLAALSMLSKKRIFLCLGLSFILVALWDLLGYKLRWKHIGCAYQLMYHGQRPVNPENISWSAIKRNIFSSIAVSLFVGIALVAFQIFVLRFG